MAARQRPNSTTTTTILLIVVTIFANWATCHMVGNNPYRRREILDPGGKYQLEWLVDWQLRKVTFYVIVQTVGYVGFGLSGKGKMSGADLVIGGVDSKAGGPYFTDYHAVGQYVPEVDPSQDWILHEASENGTHTYLEFSRDFDTKDRRDYIITEDKISLIWAYGEDDNVGQYHHQNRGSYNILLINPDYTPENLHSRPDIKVWTISQTMRIPSSHTTYWCTMQAAPRLSTKHHIIGAEISFPDEQNRKAVHHIQINKCNVPNGANARAKSMFSPFLKHKGQSCYALQSPKGAIPTKYCTQMVHGQAIGSRIMFYPPHLGIPLGTSRDEYYVLQVHYDNPHTRDDLTITVNYNLYYTSKLREHDASALGVGVLFPGMPPAMLIPPHSIDHWIQGHCSEACTRKILPPEGIKLFSATPHTHSSGRKVILEHYRGGKQLEPVFSDNNYDPNFQQSRVFNREAQVLPGDRLVMNCMFDNTWTNGSTVGGFASFQEMCLGLMIYYNKMEYSACSSQIISESGRRHFLAGITNVTWIESHLDYVVDAPHPLAGMTVTEVSDNHVHWSLKMRKELQRFHFEEPHDDLCVSDDHGGGFGG